MASTTASGIGAASRVPHSMAGLGRTLLGDVVATGRTGAQAALAGLDGVVIGLVVAFVVAAALSGPAKYLPLPWPLEVVAIGALAAAVAGFGALAGQALRRAVLLL